MTLKEISQRHGSLGIYENRRDEDNYSELVFYTKDTEKWNKIFSDMLGSPIKPQGGKPIRHHEELTKDYGGIQINQTLFKKDFEDSTVIAMYWPWANSIHTTLKKAIFKQRS